MRVQSLAQEDPLEKEMAIHSSILCLKISMDRGAWWTTVHGLAESDMTERLHFHFSLSCLGEGSGNPLHCSCLENPRDGGSWWAAVYGVAQSWTQLKCLSSSSSSSSIYVSILFSQIIPPCPSTESKSLFFMSVSYLLPCL